MRGGVEGVVAGVLVAGVFVAIRGAADDVVRKSPTNLPSRKASRSPAATAALHRHTTIVRVRRRESSGTTSARVASTSAAAAATLAIGATPARAARRAAEICAHIASRGTMPSGAL